MKYAVLAATLWATGCAETMLMTEIGKVNDSAVSLQALQSDQLTMSKAVGYTNAMADAYSRAGLNTVYLQDVAGGVVTIGAVGAALGQFGGLADTLVAERAAVGGLGQVYGQRAAPKSAIEAMYTGARRLNCLSTIGVLKGDDVAADEQRDAAFVLVLMTKEVLFQTQQGLAQDPVTYSEIADAISATLPAPTDQSESFADDNTGAQGGTLPIDEFYHIAARCLGTNAGLPDDVGDVQDE